MTAIRRIEEKNPSPSRIPLKIFCGGDDDVSPNSSVAVREVAPSDQREGIRSGNGGGSGSTPPPPPTSSSQNASQITTGTTNTSSKNALWGLGLTSIALGGTSLFIQFTDVLKDFKTIGSVISNSLFTFFAMLWTATFLSEQTDGRPQRDDTVG